MKLHVYLKFQKDLEDMIDRLIELKEKMDVIR